MKRLKLSGLISLMLAAAMLLAACSARQPLPVAESPSAAQNRETVLDTESAVLGSPEPQSGTGVDTGELGEPDQKDFDIPELPGENLPVPSGEIMEAVTPMSLAAAPSFNLEIPSTFKVTRPTENISTTAETYFITGTSDPGRPVYIDGAEIARQGSKGTFGVYVQLAMGNNSFTLRQGDTSSTVTITRKAKSAAQPISSIIQSSMYPAVQGGVKVGDKMIVECTAPSGATVVASFGGRSVTLQQVATANSGMPAVYRGEITVDGDYPSGVTEKAGKVSYELRYNGNTARYQSTGDVYVAGAGSYIAIKVTAYQGFVYPDPADPETFREKLKTGATDYVYSENNTHYKLYSGGYIPKGLCAIIEGEVKIGNKVKSAVPSYSPKEESFSFEGITTPAYYTNYTGGVFSLTLYNTNGTPPVNIDGSKLFSSVTATANDNSSVTYAFTVKDPALYWGYQVGYDGVNTVLSFRYKPRLSANESKPFDGITVMLDPGHGGRDPGALGVAGLTGPNENTLNLANAYAVRDTLTGLGANVIFTRSGLGDSLELDERLQVFEASDADIFISLHHNSMGESTDSNKITGTEAFYHTPHSADIANSVLEGFTNVVGRTNRGAKSGYYRVTLLPHAPSLLIELGFLSNPLEYEKCCDPDVIKQSARGVAEGLKLALR